MQDNSKKFGPKTRSTIYKNDYKEKQTHPDYVTRGTWQIPLDDEFLRYLVDGLRTDGVEPRVSVAMWENQDKDGKPCFGIELQAVHFQPQDDAKPSMPPAPPATPVAPEPKPFPKLDDDIPF